MNFHGRRLNVAGIVCKAVGAFEVGRQQVTMTFDGGQIVSDAELLPMRELDLNAAYSPNPLDG